MEHVDRTLSGPGESHSHPFSGSTKGGRKVSNARRRVFAAHRTDCGHDV